MFNAMSVPSTATVDQTAPTYRSALRYRDRQTKAAYIADKYRQILTDSVLDVGCDTKRIGSLIPRSVKYVGIDMSPVADVVLDLDAGPLPFADRSFNTVLCTDVLEHLEHAHRVFDELCRVSDQWVIVSLPNPIRHMLEAIGTGCGSQLKYYGLPTDRPSDRHRWFFGIDDAKRFLSERGARAGYEVAQFDMEEGNSLPPGCSPWLDAAGRNILDHPAFKGATLWCVLRRAA